MKGMPLRSTPFTVRELSRGEQAQYGKRFEAVFEARGANSRGPVVRRFGAPGAVTWVDGAPKEKKKAYIARHGAPKSGQDWTESGRGTPGWLSRWILWGPSRSLKKNVQRKGGRVIHVA